MLFDAVAATASRHLQFPYVWASVGSFAIYSTLGAFAARHTGMAAAIHVGLIVGLVDATIGELISSAIGPVRSPLESSALTYRVILASEVIGIAVLLSSIGGFAAMRWARNS